MTLITTPPVAISTYITANNIFSDGLKAVHLDGVMVTPCIISKPNSVACETPYA